MDFRTAMRIKHGKQPGNMDEVDNYFASLAPGEFKTIGKASARQGAFMKKKKLKPSRKPGQPPRSLGRR